MTFNGNAPPPNDVAPSDSSPVDIELHALHCELVRFEALLANVDDQLAPVKNGVRVPAAGPEAPAAPDSALSPLGDTLRTLTRRVERARHRLAALQMSLEV